MALGALGVYMGKSRVYDAMQVAAEKVPGPKRQEVFARIKTPAVGDVTSVKCNGEWLSLELTVDELSGEDAETLKECIEPIAVAVGAEILITDDADGFKTVADELGLDHQVCESHVKRNRVELKNRPRATKLSSPEICGKLQMSPQRRHRHVRHIKCACFSSPSR